MLEQEKAVINSHEELR